MLSLTHSQYPGLRLVGVCVWGGGCAAHPGSRVVLSCPGFKDLGAQPLRAGAGISAFASPSAPGVYVCAKCGYELFSSHSKYAHSSPWPAFTETIHADSVAKRPEHNRPGALKVGGSSRGPVGWPPSPAAPQQLSVCSGPLASAGQLPPQTIGRVWGLVGTGHRTGIGVGSGMESASHASRYLGRWMWGGHHLLVAAGRPLLRVFCGQKLTRLARGLPRCPVADVATDWAMSS